jgi:ketol-acid reductoisomerase
MTMIYHEDDGDLSFLAGKPVGVIGYGSLGRSIALNLRDSGVQVVVSEADASRENLAREEEFYVLPTVELVKRVSIILLLVSEEIMPEVYLSQVSPYLKRNDLLVVCNAYSIAFGYIEPPPFVDVGLIAPRTLGTVVRERYLDERGFYSFIAVGQDASSKAWSLLLALAKALGTLKAGAIEIRLEQEAELDLFIQQAVLPAFHHILITAAQLLLRMGYPPEAALTDLYLSGEFTDYMERAAQLGFMDALRSTSPTSQYGILMEIVLEEIRSGKFAQEWSKENADGQPRLKKLLRNREALELWELEQQTLDMLYPYRNDNFET